MASSSSQIQTVTSLTSSLSLLHDYAASAYTSALTRLVELEHEHEETARSITWLTASLAEDKDVFKTKVPPQLARAIVDYMLLGKLMCTVKAGMMRKWFEGGEESNKVYCTDASLCVHVCVHVVPHLASP